MADDVDGDELEFGRGFDGLSSGLDGEARDGRSADGGEERRDLVGWAFDADDASELSRHAHHAAIEPIATVIGDDVSKVFNQSGTIGSEDCHNEM